MLGKKLRLMLIFFCLIMCMMVPVRMKAEEKIDYLTIGNVDIYKDGELFSNYVLPAGMEYDSGKNTITMKDCNLNESIYYGGVEDLHIVVYGNNKVSAIFMDLLSGRAEGKGDLYISGNGTITSSDLFYIQKWTKNKEADLYIEGVTLINAAIDWDGGNLHVKNAKVSVNGIFSAYNGSYGIKTRPAPLGGKIFIDNSDIEFRNCDIALEGSDINLSGVNVYGGDSAASYQIDPAKMFGQDYYSKTYNMAGYGYLYITPRNLNLPMKGRLYGIDWETYIDGESQYSEYAELSKNYAFSGEQVDIKVTPPSGYVLDYILLGKLTSYGRVMSDEPVSGSSFIMPGEDVFVEIYMKKGNADNSTVSAGNTGSPTAGSGTTSSLLQEPNGTVIKNVSGGNYKVTGGGTVEFVKPVGKKKTVNIPNFITQNGVTYRVTSIAANAFKNNKKVTKVVIGDNVEKIGAKVFYKCTGLTKINLPYGLKSLGKQAFYGCSKLKTINVWMGKIIKGKIGSKAFSGVNRKVTVNIYNNASKTASIKKILKSKGMPTTAKYKSKAAF